MTAVYILLPILIVLLGFYVVLYNGLVRARQKVKESWSGIDVQLKRRYDLIPNLVETVKAYAKHEKELFEKVTQARSEAISIPDGNIEKQAEAENMLSGTLKSLFAVSENYPDLKANTNFLKLQSDITETEDQIAAARRIYNGNVSFFNMKVQTFPSRIVASQHGFTEEKFFEVDTLSREALNQTPEIKF